MVFNRLFAFLVRCILRFRYRIEIEGIDEIAQRGTSGILFLPNHPALIDPMILTSHIYPKFAPRPLADREQLDRPVVGWLAKRIRALPIHDPAKHGSRERQMVIEAIDKIAESLTAGDNVILYPAGEILRSKWEDLGANSAVETVLKKAPTARVVLVRTRGLWGSAFSRASGIFPLVGPLVPRVIINALANFIFFGPRRRVEIDLAEPEDLPRQAGRVVLNRYIQDHFNDAARDAAHVPYTIWERGGRRKMPEPEYSVFEGSPDDVPDAIRQLVLSHVAGICGVEKIEPEMKLAHDLGLDSLAIAELISWAEGEFGFPVTIPEAVRTVGDLLLVASGMGTGIGDEKLQSIPSRWFRGSPAHILEIAPGETMASAFLAQARRSPDLPICADQIAGVRTNRDLVLAAMVMTPEIDRLEGDAIGIMLPAGVAAIVAYLAVIFSGKKVVFLNWTAGSRNVVHALNRTGARTILTASALVRRLEEQGIDLGELAGSFLYLEDLRQRLPVRRKLFALLASRISWHSLHRRATRIKPDDPAVILFTSGSESLPKAVPLTHHNVLANVRDAFQVFHFTGNDRLLGMLPPFHSFGFTATLAAPLLGGLPVVYHPNPTEGLKLARLIRAYGVTVSFGTPTFLAGIFRAADEDSDLASLRLAVSGGEKCPEGVYDEAERRWPRMIIVEGYGITECGPIVSVTPTERPMRGSIGLPLPSVEVAVVDPDSNSRLGISARGMLLVRGPSVFDGYLGHDIQSPFVQFEGKRWYRTGDLVTMDGKGYLHFAGRLKRFVKLGGEMISLPAIEDVLMAGSERGRTIDEEKQGPMIAVTATGSESHPELILFTTMKIERADVNQLIRTAGLSPLHNIRKVVEVDHIPVLGTGKTDYQRLKVEE